MYSQPALYRPCYPDPVLGLPLASWWRRVGGAVIDSFVVAAAASVVPVPAYFLLFASFGIGSTRGQVDPIPNDPVAFQVEIANQRVTSTEFAGGGTTLEPLDAEHAAGDPW